MTEWKRGRARESERERERARESERGVCVCESVKEGEKESAPLAVQLLLPSLSNSEEEMPWEKKLPKITKDRQEKENHCAKIHKENIVFFLRT